MYQDSHSEKFLRTRYAVKIGEKWYDVSMCECGQIHSYQVLTSGQERDMKKMEASELSSELREHIRSREGIIRRTFPSNELEKMFADKEKALSAK